jgi:hypothetical protein
MVNAAPHARLRLRVGPRRFAAACGRHLTMAPLRAAGFHQDQAGPVLQRRTPPAHDSEARVMAALRAADLALIPVRPSRLDLAAVARTAGLAKSAGVTTRYVISQAVARSSLAGQAVTVVSKYGPIAGIVHGRTLFASAMTDERLVAVASSSLVESGEEVGRKLQTILRRELASAEYARQEAKAQSRRWRLAVLCLVVAFLAFGGGFTAALSLQQLGLVAIPR